MMKQAREKLKWALVSGALVVTPLLLNSLLTNLQSARRDVSPPAQAISQSPFLLPCQTGGETRALSFRSKLRLNRQFMSENDQAAIALQLRYLAAYLTYDPEIARHLRVFLAAEEPRIRILQTQSRPYGADLKLDRVVEYQPNDYSERALRRGFAQASDEAREIEYEAQVKLTFCRFDRDDSYLPEIRLPLDPYLAFWYVPAAARRELVFNGKSERTNPCADAEMADLKAPSFYWYVWKPRAETCQQLLKKDVHWVSAKATLGPIERNPAFAFGGGLRQTQAPLTGTAIFGTLQPWSIHFDAKDLYRILTQVPGSPVESAKAFARALREEPALVQPPLDLGEVGFLDFLSQLDHVLVVDQTELTQVQNHIRLIARGRLKLSGRALKLQFYFGGTDAGAGGSEHWPVLRDAIATDDLVFYLGHSGMGNNLSLKRMLSDLKLSPKEARALFAGKRYQVLSVLSCRAFSYFGSDIARFRKEADAQNQTDLMAMTGSTYRPLLTLGILRHLDLQLQGQTPRLGDSLRSFTDPDETYVFERI